MFKQLYTHHNFLDDPHCGDIETSGGSLVMLGSTDIHEVQAKQMNPHRGATPLTKSQFTDNIEYR
jgi:hypothetical protein